MVPHSSEVPRLNRRTPRPQDSLPSGHRSRLDAVGLGIPLRIYILDIAHLTCSYFEIMPQNTEEIEKYIEANFFDLGSIFNLGNARLEDADHLGQLALRQAKLARCTSV